VVTATGVPERAPRSSSARASRTATSTKPIEPTYRNGTPGGASANVRAAVRTSWPLIRSAVTGGRRLVTRLPKRATPPPTPRLAEAAPPQHARRAARQGGQPPGQRRAERRRRPAAGQRRGGRREDAAALERRRRAGRPRQLDGRRRRDPARLRQHEAEQPVVR